MFCLLYLLIYEYKRPKCTLTSEALLLKYVIWDIINFSLFTIEFS